MAINNNTTKINELIDAINALPEAGTDTSDATATANDMAEGKTAYVNGQKITGNLTVNDSPYKDAELTESISNEFAAYWYNTERQIIEQGAYVGVSMPLSDFGNATKANVLSGRTFTSSVGAKASGSMTNNGAVSGTISTKAGSYTVPAGYHNGSGKVSISSTEQAKIIADNIKSGISILGVTGTFEGGGGLPDGFSALASGTVTYSSGTYAPSISHGLGTTPNFFYVFVEGNVSISNNSGYMVGHIACKQPFESNSGYYTTISITSAGINSMSGNVISSSNINSYFGSETFMPYGFFKAGLTYRWVCGVMDIA